MFLCKNKGIFVLLLCSVTHPSFFYKKIPFRELGMGFEKSKLLRSGFFIDVAVYLTDNRLFPNLPFGKSSYCVASVSEPICYTSLEEHLLVSEDELLVGLGFVLESVYNHDWISCIKNKVRSLYGKEGFCQKNRFFCILSVFYRKRLAYL